MLRARLIRQEETSRLSPTGAIEFWTISEFVVEDPEKGIVFGPYFHEVRTNEYSPDELIAYMQAKKDECERLLSI